MEWTPSGWRLRSRSRHCPVDYSTNVLSLAAAQSAAREHLEKRKVGMVKPRASSTLLDLVEVYKKIPKRAGEDAERISISRLKTVTRLVLKKELEQAPSNAVDADYWLTYIAKKQGREVADLATRAPENVSINSAMRSASAIFAPKLRPLYAKAGIVLSPDASIIQWLPEMDLPRAPVDDEKMIQDWRALRYTSPSLWYAVGLARFGGLRFEEVEAAQRTWVEVDGDVTYIRQRDRPDEGWMGHKTGENYRAPIIDVEFAEALRACEKGPLVPTPEDYRSRKHWFKTKPREWVRKYAPSALKPLHRLRGLYSDDVAKIREDAVTAKLAGERAAADALGHTSTKTTKKHYLKKDE